MPQETMEEQGESVSTMDDKAVWRKEVEKLERRFEARLVAMEVELRDCKKNTDKFQRGKCKWGIHALVDSPTGKQTAKYVLVPHN